MNHNQFMCLVCLLLGILIGLILEWFIFDRPRKTKRVKIENLIEPEDLQD